MTVDIQTIGVADTATAVFPAQPKMNLYGIANSIDDYGMYAALRQACAAAGSQRAFAEQIGVTEAFISAVLHGRKAPGPTVLAAVGLRRIVRYVPTRGVGA